LKRKEKPKVDSRDYIKVSPSPKNLSKKEVAQIEDVWKRIRKGRIERRPDARDTFNLIYLGFLGNIKNRKLVERDLKELKRMIDASAAKMMEILAKSEGLAANDHPTAEKVNTRETRNILDFLNSAKTAGEIADAIEIPGERDVGVRVARNILVEREKIRKFTKLDQILAVPQVGPERFEEIIHSLRKRRPL
jgi:hypothetical protein